MLLLLIKTLTNAPNNSSVRTVSERSGVEDSYRPTDTRKRLNPLTGWTFLALNSARLALKEGSNKRYRGGWSRVEGGGRHFGKKL